MLYKRLSAARISNFGSPLTTKRAPFKAIMRSLPKFFLVTFSTTWICWAASFAISQGIVATHPTLALLAGAVFLLGVFAPALVALALTKRNEGRAATQSLLSQIFKWDVGWRWYL